ncbi:hypothetical protein C8R44DRAFT_731298 [Mycena epipterygia]|nr:hypothetical protein C8R44DRAFT_731298 [Mycena epipterygia]
MWVTAKCVEFPARLTEQIVAGAGVNVYYLGGGTWPPKGFSRVDRPRHEASGIRLVFVHRHTVVDVEEWLPIHVIIIPHYLEPHVPSHPALTVDPDNLVSSAFSSSSAGAEGAAGNTELKGSFASRGTADRVPHGLDGQFVPQLNVEILHINICEVYVYEIVESGHRSSVGGV